MPVGTPEHEEIARVRVLREHIYGMTQAQLDKLPKGDALAKMDANAIAKQFERSVPIVQYNLQNAHTPDNYPNEVKRVFKDAVEKRRAELAGPKKKPGESLLDQLQSAVKARNSNKTVMFDNPLYPTRTQSTSAVESGNKNKDDDGRHRKTF